MTHHCPASMQLAGEEQSAEQILIYNIPYCTFNVARVCPESCRALQRFEVLTLRYMHGSLLQLMLCTTLGAFLLESQRFSESDVAGQNWRSGLQWTSASRGIFTCANQ